MKRAPVLCAVCICLALIGCGTTIESVKADIPADTKVDNVYAVLDMGSGAPTFNELVKNHFELKFQEAGIKGVVRLVTGLELDQDAFEKEAMENQSEYLLVVQMTEGTVGRYNIQETGVYDVSIYDVGTEKRIWRAKVESAGMAYGDAIAKGFVDKIFESLKNDGLL